MRVALGVLLGVPEGVRVADLLSRAVSMDVAVLHADAVAVLDCVADVTVDADAEPVPDAFSEGRAVSVVELDAVAGAVLDGVAEEDDANDVLPVALVVSVALLDAVPCPDCEAQLEAFAESVDAADALVLTVDVALSELCRGALRVAGDDDVGVGVTSAVCVGVAALLYDGFAELEVLGEPLGEGEPLGLLLATAVRDDEGQLDGVAAAERDAVPKRGDTLGEAEGDGQALLESDAIGEGELERELRGVRELLAERLSVE